VTAKSILRFLIGYVIASILMGLLLPKVGIPRAQLLPPALVYANATGKGSGVVTKKHWRPTANPFHVGDKVYLVSYAFKAKAPVLLGTTGGGKIERYTGTVKVEQEVHDRMQIGDVVQIKYDPTYPVISGINQPGFGRSGAQGSGLFSAWWLWMFLALLIGYLIAPFLERFMLRESY
jgi:hypothetical protein